MQGPLADLEPVLPTGQRTWHPAGKKELSVPFTGRRRLLLCTRQAQGQLQGPGWLAEARLTEQEAAQVRQAIAGLKATLKGRKEPLPREKSPLAQ